MMVGRILVNNKDKGSGFALATSNSEYTRVVITANHVVGNQEASSLQFETQVGRKISVERVERDNDLDVAVLHLSEDVAEGLAVGHALEGGSWQVETQPRPNDPKLYGTITDTHRRFVKQDGGHEIYVLQLHEKQNLGDYKGYSGSPVVLKSPTDAVIGVLIEQLRSRLSVPTGQPKPATNVLYAIPIQDVLDRFDLPHVPKDEFRARFADVAGITHQDWDSAPGADDFFVGRTKELDELEQWIVEERCQLVVIVGMGGIGKTDLAVTLGKGGIGKTQLSAKLARGIQAHFEFVIWRRLLSAPKVTETLEELIRFLSNQQEVNIPTTLDEQIPRLLHYLKQHRCLLILDNVERILQGGKHAGQYNEGYEGYGLLFKQVAEVPHQSCLLITSREIPQEIAWRDSKTGPVRSLGLRGLDYIDGKKIFARIPSSSFSASEEEWRRLNDLYRGNPLALKLVAMHIHAVYSGDITEFLNKGKLFFDDLHGLLDWHFDRLSDAQKEIVYWLAINSEPMSLSDLEKDILSPIAKEQVPSTLQSLQGQLPLEKSSSFFTLQPVLIEYTTTRLIEQIIKEIKDQIFKLFHTHALLKASAKDYIRVSQSRNILKPIINGLLEIWGSQVRLEAAWKQIVSLLRETYTHTPSYAAGNILNLLVQLQSSLRDYDFSGLVVKQAYLQGVDLPGINFARTTVESSRFTQLFESVHVVELSPNGQLLATGTAAGEIRCWDASTGEPFRTYQRGITVVRSIAFSPDGKLLASGSDDGSVQVWEVSTGKLHHVLQGHTNLVRAVAFDPDGKLLASGSEDGTIRFWEVDTGKCSRILLADNRWVMSLAFSPDGGTLASGGSEHVVRLWHVSTGERLQMFEGHSGPVRAVAFSPDGKLIASGSEDKTVSLWTISTGQCQHTFQGHSDRIRAVAFSSDGGTLASGSDDWSVRLWDTRSGILRHVLTGHDERVWSVTFSLDGKTIISGSEDQSIRFWEVDTGKCSRTLQGYSFRVWSVAFHPNGTVLASAGEDKSIRLWNTTTWQYRQVSPGHNKIVRAVAFSPDERMLASGSEDRSIRFWELNSGDCSPVQGFNSRVWSIAFHPNGTMLVSIGEDRFIRLWDIATRQYLKAFPAHAYRTYAVAFSPNGSTLASSGDDSILRLWNLMTDECQTIQEYNTRVYALAFSPDGSKLASGGDDHCVRLWDTTAGKCLQALYGHSDRIQSIAFNNDGQWLASGGDDRSVRLWDTTTGQCAHILKGHTNVIRAVTFSPDGRIVASGSDDGKIRIWEVRSGKPLQLLRSERPCERMNITDVKGLNDDQKATLRKLGAFEDEEQAPV